jgi:hypothetical protein
MGRGRQTRRPRLRSLSRETRQKVAEGAEKAAEKVAPEPKKEAAPPPPPPPPPAKKSTSGGGKP